ncbi:MAG: hypothetical protein J5706_03355 [Elusimicrobiales bacterium]|nr:hypothetical protein [Elusimicrobiales bacterium]
MQFTGISGNIYSIENHIGKGGEGDVYSIKGLPGFVLKTYNAATLQRSSRTREEKLKAMAASSINSDMVAWPKDVVYENGRFAGFVMPAVIGYVPLNHLYATDDKKYNLDLSKKITLARNLCAAIHAVHSLGQVCGDLNPANILADPNTGRIMLVDTDSFHIKDIRGRIYRCEVGMGTFFPAELLSRFNAGQALATMPLPTFTQQTDLFALAVLIFHLLMQGCSPFSCAVSTAVKQQSVACPQPEENILKGNFPFAIPVPGIVPPPYAPDFNYLPPNVRYLFVRAFIQSFSDPMQRPTAEEWYNGLETMRKNLAQCSANPLHKYPDSLAECPWCKIDRTMRQLMSPVPAAQPLAQQSFSQPQYSAQPAYGGTYGSYQQQYSTYSQTSSGTAGVPAKTPLPAALLFQYAAVALLAQLIWQNTAGNIITSMMFSGSWVEKLAMGFHPGGDYLLVPLITCAILANAFSKKQSYLFVAVFSLIVSLMLKNILYFFTDPIYSLMISFGILPQTISTMRLFNSGNAQNSQDWPVQHPVGFFIYWTAIVCLPIAWEFTIGQYITGMMFGDGYGTGILSWIPNIAKWIAPGGYSCLGFLAALIALWGPFSEYLNNQGKFEKKVFLWAALAAIVLPLLLRLLCFIFVSPLWAIGIILGIWLTVFLVAHA